MADFIKADTQLPPYLAFPRFLLELDISETAKLLYMVLLDRARLSLQNEGWIDEQGRVFLYYTIKNMAATLHRSDVTIKTALNVLSDRDLIYRFRQGAGNPNRIYVKLPAVMERNLLYGGQENLPTDGKKTSSPGGRKLSTNKKEISNNKGTKQESKGTTTFGSYGNVFLTDTELTDLQADFGDWQERIERLSSYMASSGRTYQNHAATIRLWASKDKPKAATIKRTYECKENESL